MKILSITHNNLRVDLPFQQTYKKTCDEILDTEGLLLPQWKQLPKMFLQSKDVRIVIEDFYMQIETEDEYIDCIIKRGGMIDFGSTPRWSRSITDNDDRDMLVGFIPHDVGFGIDAGFKFSNQLLRAIHEYMGVGIIVRNAVYFSVASPFGKRAYKKSPMRLSYNSNTMSIERTKK